MAVVAAAVHYAPPRHTSRRSGATVTLVLPETPAWLFDSSGGFDALRALLEEFTSAGQRVTRLQLPDARVLGGAETLAAVALAQARTRAATAQRAGKAQHHATQPTALDELHLRASPTQNGWDLVTMPDAAAPLLDLAVTAAQRGRIHKSALVWRVARALRASLLTDATVHVTLRRAFDVTVRVTSRVGAFPDEEFALEAGTTRAELHARVLALAAPTAAARDSYVCVAGENEAFLWWPLNAHGPARGAKLACFLAEHDSTVITLRVEPAAATFYGVTQRGRVYVLPYSTAAGGVRAARAALAKLEAVPPSQLLLIFDDVPVHDDDAALGDVGIRPGHTLKVRTFSVEAPPPHVGPAAGDVARFVAAAPRLRVVVHLQDGAPLELQADARGSVAMLEAMLDRAVRSRNAAPDWMELEMQDAALRDQEAAEYEREAARAAGS